MQLRVKEEHRMQETRVSSISPLFQSKTLLEKHYWIMMNALGLEQQLRIWQS